MRIDETFCISAVTFYKAHPVKRTQKLKYKEIVHVIALALLHSLVAGPLLL
ncbi:predicted protein [Sclerotinia sclerotiorum 1980 UF-70]|uniref:Uncharacterized protein n=1 Tax=Sclerotinia sclerotiorum (strain ATCC 18683 / 1980 / Ss-1) TaxID=665079 RepID=A7ETY2_SCLS1|nr:predicted protein [Sclerotinia sclerotiorum 1980 UF-70]EDN92924.1 predicted protein [Sclerotinia sclerotiorum 1980 UF-70]